jgi:hypothetical protein
VLALQCMAASYVLNEYLELSVGSLATSAGASSLSVDICNELMARANLLYLG